MWEGEGEGEVDESFRVRVGGDGRAFLRERLESFSRSRLPVEWRGWELDLVEVEVSLSGGFLFGSGGSLKEAMATEIGE